MIAMFSSENAIKEKKILELPATNLQMFSTLHMLFWHLVFQGHGAGHGCLPKVC